MAELDGLINQMMQKTGLDLGNNMQISDNKNLEIVLDAPKLKALLARDPKIGTAIDLTIENNVVKIKFKLLG